MTPLHEAAGSGHEVVVQMLLHQGEEKTDDTWPLGLLVSTINECQIIFSTGIGFHSRKIIVASNA